MSGAQLRAPRIIRFPAARAAHVRREVHTLDLMLLWLPLVVRAQQHAAALSAAPAVVSRRLESFWVGGVLTGGFGIRLRGSDLHGLEMIGEGQVAVWGRMIKVLVES